MALWIDGIPSPFHLPRPGEEWLRAIESYDADLRLFPSQKDPCYRLMRAAKLSGGMSPKAFESAMSVLHPDTRLAIQYGLVAVTTVPPGAIHASSALVVQWLRDHDLWKVGGAERAADLLEVGELRTQMAKDAAQKDEGRQRHLASRVAFQYRSGTRVSLVRPPRPEAPTSPLVASTPAE